MNKHQLKTHPVLSTMNRPELITQQRQNIINAMQITEPSVLLTEKTLAQLFWRYDQVFFDHFFKQQINHRITFYLSTRMTRAGGKTVYYRNSDTYRIGVAASLLKNSFQQGNRKFIINGLECETPVKAMMAILEHEMIHLLEFVCFQKSSCKGKRFQTLSRQMFGHNGITHALALPEETVCLNFNLKTGDRVNFCFKDRYLEGIVTRITKRATVMVADFRGIYRDRAGKRYSKYYVPLNQLKIN